MLSPLAMKLSLPLLTISSIAIQTAIVDGFSAVLDSRTNPSVHPDTTSPISGVRYSQVLDGLHRLYPPSELETRNALSRKDGYWPYIREGKEPPNSFTYGEFDFYFFAQLLDRVHEIWKYENGESFMRDWSDKVFVDIGSGTGRLVVAAASLHPSWKACRGIELLPSIHDSAVDIVEQHCRHSTNGNGNTEKTLVSEGQALPMAPVDLVCGSFDDDHVRLGDSDVIFMFSSAVDQSLLTQLSHAIGRECKPGTLVITTDYPLDLEGTVTISSHAGQQQQHAFRLEKVDEIDGWCWCTGGQTTAHIHRVSQSAKSGRPSSNFELY